MEKEPQYELVEISKLIPYVNNARTHSEEQIVQIASSIKEFGFLNPIIVSEDNTILCGHGRYEGAKKLNLKKVPCIRESHLSEAQKKAYIIADNKLAENAGWDTELLNIELAELDNLDFDLEILGFDDIEISDIFDIENEKTEKEDDFDLTAALEKASFVERGDVWYVGRHKLMCGDATSGDDVATLMDGKKANLVITDPPYNVAFECTDGLTIKNDKMGDDAFYEFLLSAFKNMADNLDKGGAAYVFHADTEGHNFRKAFIEAGFHLAGCCVWVKNHMVIGRSDYQWKHEPVLYGFLQNGKHYWSNNAGRSQTTVWNFDKPRKIKDHPTSKPIDLLAYPIGNSSQANAIVIDTFAGSGSTLIACETTNRICYSMEIDEKYASVILRRYVEDTNDADNVYVIRNGEKIYYKDLVKEVERN